MVLSKGAWECHRIEPWLSKKEEPYAYVQRTSLVTHLEMLRELHGPAQNSRDGQSSLVLFGRLRLDDPPGGEVEAGMA
jgi:hypothetical protein